MDKNVLHSKPFYDKQSYGYFAILKWNDTRDSRRHPFSDG